jgi:hypothetical protein
MTASDHCSSREKTLANRGPSTHEAALLIDLFELLSQFDDQSVNAFQRYSVRHRRPGERPVVHDLHFEFHTLVY